MTSVNRVSCRRPLPRRPGGRRVSLALGWVLLLLGLSLLVWRVQVDLNHRWPEQAITHVRPLSRSRMAPPIAVPSPRPTVVPLGNVGVELPIQGGPSLDARTVDAILGAYDSPLAGHGADLVALSRRYRIDDAIALAFFVMESRAGTRGEALLTNNVGNIRPPGATDGYSGYDSWLAGATEWFQLMRGVYLDTLKLETVEAAVPVYAPAVDGNDPPSMIAGIRQLVSCWRGTVAVCPSDPAGMGALVASAHPPVPREVASGHPAGSP